MEYQYFERFEYKTEYVSQSSLISTLNELGKEGWELIYVDPHKDYLKTYSLILKRKLNCAKDIINE